MNMKVKTSLIIIATLIFGMICGALLSRAYLHHRIRRAVVMVNPNRFMPFLERVIDPTPEQREQIRTIIQDHAGEVLDIRRDFEKNMTSSFESLRKELDSVLTPGQKKRLERSIRERRPWMRRDRPRLPRRKVPFDPPPNFPPDKKSSYNF
jgi:hypothetical protein